MDLTPSLTPGESVISLSSIGKAVMPESVYRLSSSGIPGVRSRSMDLSRAAVKRMYNLILSENDSKRKIRSLYHGSLICGIAAKEGIIAVRFRLSLRGKWSRVCPSTGSLTLESAGKFNRAFESSVKPERDYFTRFAVQRKQPCRFPC